jgi:uncharacterized membrane protein
MTHEKVLYTDGHEVTVTESFFKVRKTMYQLKGIIHHDFLVIHPHRIPALLVMLVGALIIFLAVLHWLPINSMPDFRFFSVEINAKETAMVVGSVLLIVGTIILSRTKERYAIRLATAEGIRNVLVSKRKEYVTQILDALNRAFMGLISPREVGKNRRRAFMVGSR